jgi:NAD+ kinase
MKPSASDSARTSPQAHPSRFHHVALIGKFQAADTHKDLHGLAVFLTSQGLEVSVERETALNTGISDFPTVDVDAIGRQCDLAVVVGGDGTMLGVGRRLASHGVPMIGVNQGRVGFITDIALEDYRDVLPPMLAGEYDQESRGMMQAQVWREGHCVFEASALNDVVVNRGSASGMIELRIEVNDHFVANQRADGLIIASPTGSTAYAMSAGGPIVHPSVAGWVMAPIAPHTLSNRPIVLPFECEVVIEIVRGLGATANFDMQSLTSLLKGDRITVRAAAHGLRLLHPIGWNYFDTLRKKLHWNEGAA